MTLQKECDILYSRWLRMTSADEFGYCTCITCGATIHWNKIQCGHYIDRDYLILRYEPINTAPQCEDCNCFKKGNTKIFKEKLIEIHGVEAIENLDIIKHQTVHNFDYKEKIKELKQLIKNHEKTT